LDVAARSIVLSGLESVALELVTPQGTRRVSIPLPGLYNVYNALAAAALALVLGASLDEVEAGLTRFKAAFGRFERIPAGDKSVLLLLVKNPAGANEVVRTLVDAGRPRRVLVALNDDIADGRDVSWVWDVDFEPLLEGIDEVIVSGSRAEELALRFQYGGVQPEAIKVLKGLGAALTYGIEATPSRGELVVLPTYTAMLALRRIAAERGLVRPYWEAAA
jgi:UDP-N-acetylmuramyl tripeptide synthase